MRDLIIEQIERLASLEHGGGVNQAVSEYFRDHPGKWQAQKDEVAGMVYAPVLQPDGKLVAVGLLGAIDWALARYPANEHLDPSFGMGGIVTTNLGDTGVLMPSSSSPMASWWRPEAGVSFAGGSRHFALARYLA